MRAVMNLPIFPLSVFVLPGGITRLRIFEKKYIEMIKNIDKTNGFVICKKECHKLIDNNWGSWVELVDFYPGTDGVIQVDVHCSHLVELISIEQNKDNVSTASVKVLGHWADKAIIFSEKDNATNDVKNLIDDVQLARQDKVEIFNLGSVKTMIVPLEKIYRNKGSLYGGYYHYFEHTPSWICARWLELLPLNQASKDYFIKKDSFNDALEFLSTLFINQTNLKLN